MAGYSLRVMKEPQLQQWFFALLLLVCTSNARNETNQTYRTNQLNALQSLLEAWNTSTPNLNRNLPGWNSSQRFPCSEENKGWKRWRGVQCLKNVSCNKTMTTGDQKCKVFITGLTLKNASIEGILPKAIGNISTLMTLELTENPKLTGELPSELLWDTNLYTLDLHDNAFDGEILDLAVLKYLQILNMGGNRFTGTFPRLPHVSSDDNLQILNLSRNHLEGEIPESAFENMTRLLKLDLSSNKFNGTLPALTMFKNLEMLNLSRNAFHGAILSKASSASVSESLRINSSSLSVLDLSHNQLTSTLDSWNISELRSVEELYLDHNYISGILNISYLSELGLLRMKSANSPGLLRVLSLKNNSIDTVVYDDNVDYNISTIIRLEGSPYCQSNDNSRFHEQACFNSGRTSSDKVKKKIVIIAAVSSAISLLLLIGLVATLYKHRKYKQYSKLQMQRKFEELEVKPTIFPYNQLRTATQDFHSDMKLGQGAFGAVYKGVFPNGNIVAVKQLFAASNQGIDEFLNEVVLLTGMKHRNLVNLKGCCIREQQRLLVYEYVDNHDIDKLLLGANKTLLNWHVRFKICLGVARGLHYLHALAHPRIIHRDIKASNILLTKNNETKIADFGLALLFPDEQSYILTKHIAGTKGYLAPEYASYGQLSDKVDVFSFGVLCLEVISGRRNIDEACSPEKMYLSKWAWDLLRHEKLMDLVDPQMSLQEDQKLEVHRLINIALLCIQNEAEQRPGMERVVAMLQGESEGEVVPLKAGNEEQYLESIRLFAVDQGGLGTVKEEESSFMGSSRRGGRRSEDNYSDGAVLELSEIRVR